jgi:hypothetical protein
MGLYNDTMTEAEWLDDGGDYCEDCIAVADYVYNRHERKSKEEEILADRRRRERNLVGKYLVLVTSRYQKGLDLFLQDDKYGDGYWTRFLSNAKGFHDESAAVVKAKNLQFNNPRVVFVQANGKLKEVYSNGRCTR